MNTKFNWMFLFTKSGNHILLGLPHMNGWQEQCGYIYLVMSKCFPPLKYFIV